MKKVLLVTITLAFSIVSFGQNYKGFADVGYAAGSKDGVSGSIIGFRTTHGLEWNGAFAGIGVGYEKIKAEATVLGINITDEAGLIPLYLQGRYTFDTDKIKPFLLANIGGIYNTDYYLSDGIDFNAEFAGGIAIPVGSDIEITPQVGYRSYSDVNYFEFRIGIGF